MIIDFDKFYIENFDKFLKFTISKIKKRDVAEDITQEAFIKLHEKLLTITPGKYENWLRTVIKNKCVDYYRGKYNKNENFLDGSESMDYVSYTNNLYKSDEMCDILSRMLETDAKDELRLKYDQAIKCIDKLSPAYKITFTMFVLENRTHKEISKILKISEGTSKSNLARSRQKLIKMYENVQ